MERDLAAARTAAMANGVGVKSRLQALQIAYVLVLTPPFFLPISPDIACSLALRMSLLTSVCHELFAPLCDVEGSSAHADGSVSFPCARRYREQIDKVNRLREDTVRAVIKNSSEIVAFKDEVSKQLQYLRDFAEAN